MGAMGSWKLLSNTDPAVANKFAAAVLVAGSPANVFALSNDPAEAPAERPKRIRADLRAMDLGRVRVPLWIQHADTDPLVDRLGEPVRLGMCPFRVQ